MWHRSINLLRCAFAVLAACAPAHAMDDRSGDLADLSLEELGLIEVTSVSRQAESRFDAPAAVYVITREDILRSGVTSIPEALRLAPGVEVARRNSHSWSISIRGFNSDLANKLLVLIDGRSVYSPLYAGVFWETSLRFRRSSTYDCTWLAKSSAASLASIFTTGIPSAEQASRSGRLRSS